MAKQKKPVSKGLKTFFGVGDLGFNWMTNIETYYYAYFLTNIAQFPLALVTVIQTIGSVIDAALSWTYGIMLNKMKPLLWDKRFSGILWAVVLGAAFLMLSMLIVNFVSGIPWYLLSSMLRAAFVIIILMLGTRLYGKTTREILSLHNSKIAM